ncbi:type IV toxin-antitoxin system AbiEi family antitoxin domain-containing protein [Okibacterium endophyticum]
MEQKAVGLALWLNEHGGIAHRRDVVRGGFTRYAILAAMAADEVRVLRRWWLYTRSCPAPLVRAASVGGRLTCLTGAQHHGLWVVDDGRVHLSVRSNASVAAREPDVALHWARVPAPVSGYALVEPVVNVLIHTARCQTFERAVVVFESALNKRMVTQDELVRLRVRSAAFADVVAQAGELSDSGIESLPIHRLRRLGITVRQQVRIEGRPVDGLIGDRLVLQIDGNEHHLDPAQRERDIRHDAQLSLRGYTVLRFNYRQVMFGWSEVEATIVRAMAQGLHRSTGVRK